ncbi:AraC family transcriptional regulator [Cytobacillus depressus]|uniref:AraC family transcriptional regulator n=1 Tax=Cytobacillus depressus TaxID=1602942 RepID=A0A6L3V4D8_9BACI|nr:AraC family transcriptional regulator [Cytobacillus depressus]KAB2334896.1 AraC family transcriptional regulator [Cytobacillus depressus]
MALVESLQKAIDFMEEHLLDNITIEDIAKQANVSPFHFQRTFMILTDISVGEYLRRRRLTLAAQELSSTNSKIIDIAYKYGYDTPESFSKAFRKQHGVTPSDARKGNGKLQSYNRLLIQVNLRGAEPMKYKIVEQDAFQVIGIKETFACATKDTDAVIPKLWSRANSDGTIDSLAQLNNGQIKGLLGITDNNKETENFMDYWIAAAHDGDVPDGFSSLNISAAKWAVFEVQGPIPEAIVNTWKQIFSEWFPSNGYEYAEIPSLEVYIGSYPNPSCEIWVPIK